MIRMLAVLAVLFPAAIAHAQEEQEQQPAHEDDDDLAADTTLPDWVASSSQDVELEGDHWRLETPNGVVNVWRPKSYDPQTAGTVVYVHGHGDSSDSAWTGHNLAQQFHDSELNALFIVPEAPPDGEEDLSWESLGALLRAVAQATQVPRPPGQLVVMGHSGAFRSIVPWLDDKDIGHIILLDAMYANEEEFTQWIDHSPGHEAKKLTVVGYVTRSKSEAFCSKLAGNMKLTRIPPKFQALSKRQKEARVLYLKSQYPHMNIVTDGKVIPLVLRRTGIKGI